MNEAEKYLLRMSEVLFEVSKGGWEALTVTERIFLLVWDLEAEVNNGGFHQYFLSSASALAPEVPGALLSIGAESAASIVDRALYAFAGRFCADRDLRLVILQEVDPDLDLFEDLDEEFYSYPDNLSSLLYVFATEHASEIRSTA